MPEYTKKGTKIATIVFVLLVVIFACIFVCRNKTSKIPSWGGEASGSIVDDESETSDIFETAMYNLFNVSSAIIDNLQ